MKAHRDGSPAERPARITARTAAAPPGGIGPIPSYSALTAPEVGRAHPVQFLALQPHVGNQAVAQVAARAAHVRASRPGHKPTRRPPAKRAVNIMRRPAVRAFLQRAVACPPAPTAPQPVAAPEPGASIVTEAPERMPPRLIVVSLSSGSGPLQVGVGHIRSSIRYCRSEVQLAHALNGTRPNDAACRSKRHVRPRAWHQKAVRLCRIAIIGRRIRASGAHHRSLEPEPQREPSGDLSTHWCRRERRTVVVRSTCPSRASALLVPTKRSLYKQRLAGNPVGLRS